ncbi:hypothetical protein [Paracoccus aminophilus]|uniref:Bacteriophage tail tape measure N-terminal domain-containing protein n=1 Tax=Paracoccus aminophilus JCM 7686 TaxID=1367847 RepID=S5Y1T9_PARAH|nr:hypothetical protein [Paracoccus aminophilus]AGT09690.1 hypothetical protein JCM7686_2626 [Paracoccus aminophilus JCM 7686]
MADEPDLVVSAGFSDSQLVREANKVVAFYKKRGEEAQKAFVDAQGKVTNTEALRAHTREMDKLAKAYDPAYRAAKAYEKQVEELSRALKVGAIDQKAYIAATERAARQMKQAGEVSEQAGRRVGGGGNTLQQVGWQVGDFAVQVGAGTSAAQALGQQLPQLLGAFGTVGALAGAAAAIMIPLGAALIKASDTSAQFGDKLKLVKESTDLMKAAVEAAETPITVLAARYGEAAGAAQSFFQQHSAIARAIASSAMADLGKSIGSIGGGFGDKAESAGLLASGLGWISGADVDRKMTDTEKKVKNLADTYRLTWPQAQKLAAAMKLTTEAGGDTVKVQQAAEALQQALIDVAGGADKVAERFGGKDGLAEKAKAYFDMASSQSEALRSAQTRVVEQYQTDTEKLKKLSDDRLTAQKMLDEAIKSGSAEAIRLARERIGLIDDEVKKTRELALANDDLFKAMQQRLKAGAGSFIDGLVQSVTGNTATEWGRDGAAAQKGILELIKRRESGGDYNVTLDHGKYTGGSVNLVNMTLREVLALQKQMLSHPENTKNSSAVGAYQIVGSTLGGKGLDGSGGLIKTLNLSLDTLFTAELQDRLAQQLLREIKPGDVDHLGRVWTSTQGVNRSVINAAWGQQSIPLADPEIQKKLDEEIKERERLAKQAKEYGKTLSENLLTQQQTVEMARQQADQIAAVKASGMGAQDQARAIAEINGEFEKQKTIMMLVADAKRRNVDLDTLMTGSTLTYKQAIEALGEAKKADIIATNERAVAEGKVAERQQFMASVQDTLKDGLLDAIVAGNSFADVLGNVAKMLAKAALEAALFGSGPFSGGGSGLLGGLFGSIFGGGDKLVGALRGAGAPAVLPGRANGGPVTAGQMYMTGERGPEPFVPAVNGRILSVPQAQAALRGGQGGGSATFAPQIHIAGDASEKTVALIKAALAQEGAKFPSRWRAAQKEFSQRT